MSWETYIESERVRHVIPLDDPPGHDDTSHWEEWPFGPAAVCDCACHPRREYQGDVCIFIHSSFDGREALEWAQEILK
jgi:hypothetical protein